MEFLVRTFTVVNVLSDTCEVSKNNRANTALLANIEKLCGMFVECIVDLIVNLSDTFPLSTREFPPAFGMAFAPTDRMAEFSEDFVSLSV